MMEAITNDLFSEVRNGSRSAYEQLFRQYYAPLVRFARQILRDTDTAEDMVQEVFVKIWERRKEIEIRTAVKAYLYMAVKNHCLKKLQAEQRHAFMDDNLADDLRFSGNNTQEESDTIGLTGHITKAIDRLPPRCGLIFKMSRFENHTYQEIADVLGISVKTVENQMGKALLLLRSGLAPYLHLVIFWITLKIFF